MIAKGIALQLKKKKFFNTFVLKPGMENFNPKD